MLLGALPSLSCKTLIEFTLDTLCFLVTGTVDLPTSLFGDGVGLLIDFALLAAHTHPLIVAIRFDHSAAHSGPYTSPTVS